MEKIEKDNQNQETEIKEYLEEMKTHGFEAICEPTKKRTGLLGLTDALCFIGYEIEPKDKQIKKNWKELYKEQKRKNRLKYSK